MNSLEWINKQILLVKQNIQYHKDLLAESGKEYANEITSAIKLLEPDLQTLEQIKAELEAWYIVKKHLNRGEYVGLKNFFRFDLDKYNTLEKALEVKDELKK